MPPFSATVRSRKLGATLRQLREAAGNTGAQAAEVAETTAGTISRLEKGTAKLKQACLEKLLLFYGIEGDELQALLREAREAQKRDWWAGLDVPKTFQTYVSLETVAVGVRAYQTELIPGLLQTEAYARVVNSSEDYVTVRMARQRRLTDDENPLQLWAIIEETALRRPVGGVTVMREQLAHLLTFVGSQTVTIQVMPTSVGFHDGLDGSFVILTMPEGQEIGYVECAAGRIYLERPSQIPRVVKSYDLLRSDALSVGKSTALIRSIMKETT
jgi:transcriptional regulator with XRE-family HTH domain